MHHVIMVKVVTLVVQAFTIWLAPVCHVLKDNTPVNTDAVSVLLTVWSALRQMSARGVLMGMLLITVSARRVLKALFTQIDSVFSVWRGASSVRMMTNVCSV